MPTLFLEWGWFVEGICDGGNSSGSLAAPVAIWPYPANSQQDARAQRLPTVGFVGFASRAVDDLIA